MHFIKEVGKKSKDVFIIIGNFVTRNHKAERESVPSGSGSWFGHIVENLLVLTNSDWIVAFGEV